MQDTDPDLNRQWDVFVSFIVKFQLTVSLLFLMCITVQVNAQQAYKLNDIIANFKTQKILNGSSANGRLSGLKKELTIIDFFGTWCAPCIRALPALTALQKNYANKISVVMVSVETAEQLQKFITAQTDFPFPIVVDSNKKIAELFQPPAYPYTVVINKNNEVVDITEAALIDETLINKWLKTNISKMPTAMQESMIINRNEKPMATTNISGENKLLQLSQDFIYASKTRNETASLETQLAELFFDSLKNMLQTDDEKKAFWINLYNGFTQAMLKKDPGKYKNRSAFFKAKNIVVAGNTFSLDDIEHSILRRSKIKWSLGYLNKLFTGKTEKALRVSHLDSRIHWALNCGAKSCPPIAFYDADKINEQLNIATNAYLTRESIYDVEKNTLHLPAIMGWFRHDFKGKKNMLLLVKKYKIVPETAYPKISFAKYDWSLTLDNYSK